MSIKHHHRPQNSPQRASTTRGHQNPAEQPETPLDSQDIDKLLLSPHTAIQNDPARKAYRARLSYLPLISSQRARKHVQELIIDADSLRMAEQSLDNTEKLLEWFDRQ